MREIMVNAWFTQHLGKMKCENDCMRYGWEHTEGCKIK